MTDEEISQLPVHTFTGVEKWDDGRCSICLEEYAMNESRLKMLPCQHSFDQACIDEWLKAKRHCPLCLMSAREGEKDGVVREVEMADSRIVTVTVVVPAVATTGIVAVPIEDPSYQRTVRGSLSE